MAYKEGGGWSEGPKEGRKGGGGGDYMHDEEEEAQREALLYLIVYLVYRGVWHTQ